MSPLSRRTLAVFWLLTLAAFAGGVALLWDYLGREHARLTPVQVALVWSSEAVSGFWFLRFGWLHVVLGRPVVPPSNRERRIVIGTLVAGWAADAAMTGYKITDEQSAYRRAVPAVGRVLAGTCGTDRLGLHRWYRLSGEYTDPAGRTHPVEYAGTDHGLPGAAVVAVELGRFPSPLPLRYDPDQPARYWLTGQRTNDGRLANISLMTLAFQFLLVLGLAVPPDAGRGSKPTLPAEQFLTFGVSAFTVFVLGCTNRVTGYLS